MRVCDPRLDHPGPPNPAEGHASPGHGEKVLIFRDFDKVSSYALSTMVSARRSHPQLRPREIAEEPCQRVHRGVQHGLAGLAG